MSQETLSWADGPDIAKSSLTRQIVERKAAGGPWMTVGVPEGLNLSDATRAAAWKASSQPDWQAG